MWIFLAIERSYRLLDAEEQTLLRTLGIFVGGFALSQVEAVYLVNETQTRPVQALLHALLYKSLVRSEPTPAGESRFLLLETIREFALEQAHAQGEEALLRQRHYAAYLQLARVGDSHVRTPEVANWLARLKPERDNFRAALQWGVQEKRYTAVAWLLLALGYYWFLVGQRYATAAALKQLLPHRHIFPPDLRLAILIVSSAAVPPEDGIMPVVNYASEMWSCWMFVQTDLCKRQPGRGSPTTQPLFRQRLLMNGRLHWRVRRVVQPSQTLLSAPPRIGISS
jgi:hypothetical protein